MLCLLRFLSASLFLVAGCSLDWDRLSAEGGPTDASAMDSSVFDTAPDRAGDAAGDASSDAASDAAPDTTVADTSRPMDAGLVRDGLILHLPLDESGGPTTRETVRGVDAVIEGGASFEAGVVGNAVHLDGVDDRIIVDTGEVARVRRRFSVALFVKPDSLGSNGVLFSCPTDPHLLLRFDYDDRGTLDAISARPDYPDWPTYTTWVALDRVDTGVWQHVALTAGDGELRLYLDGAEVASASVPDPPVEDAVASVCHVGGAFWEYLDARLEGAVDDVRFYDRPLTRAEVALLAAQ